MRKKEKIPQSAHLILTKRNKKNNLQKKPIESWSMSKDEVKVGDFCLFQYEGDNEILFGKRKSHKYYQSGDVSIHADLVIHQIKINRGTNEVA